MFIGQPDAEGSSQARLRPNKPPSASVSSTLAFPPSSSPGSHLPLMLMLSFAQIWPARLSSLLLAATSR